MENTKALETLFTLKFEKIGKWNFNNNNLEIDNFGNSSKFNYKNALYVFLTIDIDGNNEIKYVGKTTQSLKSRFYGYIRGNGTSTNFKNNDNIKSAINSNMEVQIWALIDDDFPLNWCGFNINMAAGLEDDLISQLEPKWNGGKTESQNDIETRVNTENIEPIEIKESDVNVFSLKLTTTSFNLGSLNPGIDASKLLGSNNELIEIKFNNDVIVKSKINRTAVNNPRQVRIGGGKKLANFFQEKFKLGDVVQFKIIDNHNLEILPNE